MCVACTYGDLACTSCAAALCMKGPPPGRQLANWFNWRAFCPACWPDAEAEANRQHQATARRHACGYDPFDAEHVRANAALDHQNQAAERPDIMAPTTGQGGVAP